MLEHMLIHTCACRHTCHTHASTLDSTHVTTRANTHVSTHVHTLVPTPVDTPVDTHVNTYISACQHTYTYQVLYSCCCPYTTGRCVLSPASCSPHWCVTAERGSSCKNGKKPSTRTNKSRFGKIRCAHKFKFCSSQQQPIVRRGGHTHTRTCTRTHA